MNRNLIKNFYSKTNYELKLILLGTLLGIIYFSLDNKIRIPLLTYYTSSVEALGFFIIVIPASIIYASYFYTLKYEKTRNIFLNCQRSIVGGFFMVTPLLILNFITTYPNIIDFFNVKYNFSPITPLLLPLSIIGGLFAYFSKRRESLNENESFNKIGVRVIITLLLTTISFILGHILPFNVLSIIIFVTFLTLPIIVLLIYLQRLKRLKNLDSYFNGVQILVIFAIFATSYLLALNKIDIPDNFKLPNISTGNYSTVTVTKAEHEDVLEKRPSFYEEGIYYTLFFESVRTHISMIKDSPNYLSSDSNRLASVSSKSLSSEPIGNGTLYHRVEVEYNQKGNNYFFAPIVRSERTNLILDIGKHQTSHMIIYSRSSKINADLRDAKFSGFKGLTIYGYDSNVEVTLSNGINYMYVDLSGGTLQVYLPKDVVIHWKSDIKSGNIMDNGQFLPLTQNDESYIKTNSKELNFNLKGGLSQVEIIRY